MALLLPLIGVAWPVARSIQNASSERVVPVDGELARSSTSHLSGLGFHDGSSIEEHSGVEGRISTADGAVVSGAIVCARCQDRRYSDIDRRDPICVRSGADGRYSIVGVLPGRNNVAALADGYAGEWYYDERKHWIFELAPGEVRSNVDIVMKTKGVPVSGVVEDLLGGVVAGARVTYGSSWRDTPISGPVVETNERGEFTIWDEPGKTSLAISAHGYAPGRYHGVAPSDGIVVQLVPESSIRGRVVAIETKEPIPGALVTAELASYGGDPSSALSDAEGRFEIDRLAPRRYKLRAEHPRGYGESLSSVSVGLATSSEVVIELHPATSVPVKVIDAASSSGVAGCHVNAYCDRLQIDRRTRTSTGGRGSLSALLPGEYHLSAYCDWDRSGSSTITVSLGEAAEAIVEVRRAARGSMVKGRVVGASGRLPSQIEIQLHDSDGSYRAATADEKGAFTIDGVRPGRYRIYTEVSHVTVADSVIVDVKDGADPAPVEIRLHPMGEIAGRVVDRSGAPIARAQVHASMVETGTDQDGCFQVSELYGRVALRVYDERSGPLRSPGKSADGPNTVVVAGPEPVEVTIVVERNTGVITGVVVDGNGTPIPDALVSAERRQERDERDPGPAVEWGFDGSGVVTDAQGAFRLERLGEGRYSIGATSPVGHGVVFDVAVGSTAKIVIQASGRASGSVVLEDGGRPERFSIRVDHDSRSLYRSEDFFRTGGRWSLDDLPAGRLLIQANVDESKGRRSASTTLELRAGEERSGVIIQFEPSATLRGRFVDFDTGAPVAKVQVTWELIWAGGSASIGHGYSEASGAFVLERIAPGHGNVKAFKVGSNRSSSFALQYSPAVIKAEARAGENIDLGDIPLVKIRSQRIGHLGLDFSGFVAVDQAQVKNVDPDSPAARAGISVGDIITSIDGHDVTGARAYLAAGLLSVPAGRKVTLTLAGGRTVALIAD